MPIDEGSVPNGDPQEQTSAGGSQVGAGESQQTPQELANDSLAYEFGVRDELAEQFPLETIAVGVSADDGLPTPMDAGAMALAPSFGPDSVVCIEDEREFVECFAGEESEQWLGVPPGPQSAAYLPLRSRYDADGQEVERRRFSPERVLRKWGVEFVQTEEGLLRVRARRPRCQNYRRMVFANDDPTFKQGEFGHQVLYRNCTARRSVGGALMSVQDEAVYACEHRSPPDLVSVERFLDAPDRKRAATKVEMVALFNIKSEEK